MGEVAQKPADGDAPTDEALVSGSNWSRQQQPARCFPSPGRSELDEAEALDLVNGPRVCSVRQLRMQDRADPASLTELRLQADNPWWRSTDQDCELAPGEERVARHEREHMVDPGGPSSPFRIIGAICQANVGSAQYPHPERRFA